jgi:hypothetical protein
MKRHIQSWAVQFGIVIAALYLCGGAALASDTATVTTEQSAPAQSGITQQAPLTPPPGISIIPSPPMMMPPQGDAQVHGCPVRNLKPLDLLV